MTRWYRAYAGTIKDDKLAEAAVVAGCSRSVVIATWHAILESAAETAGGGRFDTTSRRVAAALGEPASVIEAVFSAMQEIGLVSGSEIPAWKRRQYESDNSTERSRKHRETLRNGNATLQGRCATPPETETETDTERERERASAPHTLAFLPHDFEPDVKTAEAQGIPADKIPSVAAKFTAYQRSNHRQSADWQSGWLKWCIDEADKRGWKPQSAQHCRDGPALVRIDPISTPDEWSAWERYRGKKLPRDNLGGWTVPTLQPPQQEARQ